jgi:hypothetical protein
MTAEAARRAGLPAVVAAHHVSVGGVTIEAVVG